MPQDESDIYIDMYEEPTDFAIIDDEKIEEITS